LGVKKMSALKRYFRKYQNYGKKRNYNAQGRVGKSFIERLENIYKKNAQGNILDLGCAEGRTSGDLLKYGFVVGVDICRPMLKKALRINKKKIPFIWGLGEKLPFKKETFDFVLCSEVIEHVLNDIVLLSEIKRVMKKKGYLLITTPRKDAEGIYSIIRNAFLKTWNKGKLPFPYHIREYTVKEFILTLKKAKFKPIKTISDKPLLPDIPFRIRLHKRMFVRCV